MHDVIRPEGHRATKPPPAADRDALDPPRAVPRAAFIEAMGSLLGLLSVDAMSIFGDITISADHLTYVSALPVAGVEPIKVGSEPELQEWGWPVRVDLWDVVD